MNSEKQWMGTLLCDYRSAEHVLAYVPKEGKPSDWTFQIEDGTMNRDAGASRKQDALSENESETNSQGHISAGLNLRWYQPGNYDWSIKR